jgi:hypothetical protein
VLGQVNESEKQMLPEPMPGAGPGDEARKVVVNPTVLDPVHSSHWMEMLMDVSRLLPGLHILGSP